MNESRQNQSPSLRLPCPSDWSLQSSPRGQKKDGSKWQNTRKGGGGGGGLQPTSFQQSLPIIHPERTLDLLLFTVAPTTTRTLWHYDKQLVMVSFWVLANSVNWWGFPQSYHDLHLHLTRPPTPSLNNGYTQAIEDPNQMPTRQHSTADNLSYHKNCDFLWLCICMSLSSKRSSSSRILAMHLS